MLHYLNMHVIIFEYACHSIRSCILHYLNMHDTVHMSMHVTVHERACKQVNEMIKKFKFLIRPYNAKQLLLCSLKFNP